ncbi:TAXI family TRAP transporter solute-binding subunit [Psychromonas sp. RZ22]|uniref:TAXI family TRAP transporter solute-binding subunit n=1 Tax=Psychromonas algarum TaxID=2555643 RepID=UPI0010673BE4|nr:TAXI family TRAP transporter solute-binding subunit [Psychromonas sp. RZ22]TEW54440.1 TAXI family TRAP transporter solute-binding subunit [Psychromonas sp. RZ22]
MKIIIAKCLINIQKYFNRHHFITINKHICALFVTLLCLFIPANALAKTEYISIATGAVNGVYYPTGGAICYLVNQVRGVDNIRCEIKTTPGSIYNISAIKKQEVDLAVVQSDWQHHAYNGTSRFEKQGELNQLRSLFSVHAEPFTVLAREDANISSFEDIKGKRVNIGAANSGQRATMEMLLSLYGWGESDFSAVTALPPGEQAQALCDKKVDVIVYVVGHPNSSIKEASSACQTKLVNVKSIKLSELITEHRYYHTAVIPGGMYRGSPEPTDTFGVGATITTTAALPEHVAYEIVKSVFEKHNEFIQLHPSFKSLTKKAMATQYLSAPLHPGALRYYQEVGLLD